ncbi:hypothetical protein GL218_03123 [Daldinia childiae]|uniref:uncharacterized protein n=1 Tax=Daldinia childiae TaxID=326645 RepID=UPI0014453BB4|nr:uncharacterized protein GL218_03123 [Daldinia childiae]KAF3060944.1 hypothetical protein GL218_03123 [Daldinia childiae]
MPSTPSTSKGDSRKRNSPRHRNPVPKQANSKRVQITHQQELALKFHDKPNGARLGLHWDFVRGKNVAYIKDHFTGAVRPAIMKDDMYDNMSKEKLEEHRRYHQQMIESLRNEEENKS